MIGLYVAHKHQVKASSDMEPYSCKSLLLNLAHEHKIKMTSFTTDRSSSVKTVMRLNIFILYHYYYPRSLFSKLSDELPPGHPKIRHDFDIWHFNKVNHII